MKTKFLAPAPVRSVPLFAWPVVLVLLFAMLFQPQTARAQTTTCTLVSVATTGPSGSTAAIPYASPSCNFPGAVVWNLNANPANTSISTVQLGTGTYAIPPGGG